MVVIVLSLLVSATLTALLVGTVFNSNSDANSSTSVTNAPGVAMATNIQAQQNLSEALTAADGAASAPGEYASVDASTLSASDPSLTFVDGPSTNSSTVSVAGGTGGLTLADLSSGGTCWLVWRGGPGPAWYGAQTASRPARRPRLRRPPPPDRCPLRRSVGSKEASRLPDLRGQSRDHHPGPLVSSPVSTSSSQACAASAMGRLVRRRMVSKTVGVSSTASSTARCSWVVAVGFRPGKS